MGAARAATSAGGPRLMSPVAFLRKSLQWRIVFFFALLLTVVHSS